MDTPADADLKMRDQALEIAPVVWLLGKVQAGKTSIICGLTGATHAEIGRGFKACTKTAEVFDFPPQIPLIRFLDTRGLSEAGYDPAQDLAVAQKASHATIAVMRAMDLDQRAVIDVLRTIRTCEPGWPIVVAQTHLHEAYPPGTNHPQPYPFGREQGTTGAALRAVPDELRRALARQRDEVSRLPGTGPLQFVPIDFTMTGDGYEPALYGLEELQHTLTTIGPAALRLALEDAQGGGRGTETARELHRLIVGHAVTAAAADLIPFAAVAAVPAIQARLLQTVASQFEIDWTRTRAMEFAGALGAGFIARYAAGFGIRQLTKLIPVYGQTAGAAAAAATSFATTYALGKAAIYYVRTLQSGRTDRAGVQQAWASALREAFELARLRGLSTNQRERT